MELSFSDELRKDVLYAVGLSVLVGILFIGIHNVMTPNRNFDIGYTEVTNICAGIDAGICLGIERQTHTTYNYDNYTNPEEGSTDYYRRIESELMYKAYSACKGDTSGMEWTSEVGYLNKTGAEWAENENVDLLPCKYAFYRGMKASN